MFSHQYYVVLQKYTLARGLINVSLSNFFDICEIWHIITDVENSRYVNSRPFDALVFL